MKNSQIIITSPFEFLKQVDLPSDEGSSLLASDWRQLRSTLESIGLTVEICPADRLSFNIRTLSSSGLIYNNKFILSTPREDEIGDNAFIANWVNANKLLEVVDYPTISFGGAQDFVTDTKYKVTWMGYGHKTSLLANMPVRQVCEIPVVGLNLISSTLTTLESCFCPLQNGWLIWCPAAFDSISVERVMKVYGNRTIDLTVTEAENGPCCSIVIDNFFICKRISLALAKHLEKTGLNVMQLELTSLSEILGPRQLVLWDAVSQIHK